MKNRRRPSSLSLSGVVAIAALLAGSCDSGVDPSEGAGSLFSYVTGATSLGASPVEATTHAEDAPAPGAGPGGTASGASGSGASRLVTVESAAPFDKVFVSVGPVETAANGQSGGRQLLWAELLNHLLEVAVRADTVQPSGHLQITLPSPVTRLSLAIRLASDIPVTNFDLQLQLSVGGGPAGPIASLPQTAGTINVSIVGIVFAQCTPNPNLPLGPCTYVSPVAGATVATSLDSRTTLTNAQGEFELVTNTPFSSGVCFTLTITAAQLPTYSTSGWGRPGTNLNGAVIALTPPQPVPNGC